MEETKKANHQVNVVKIDVILPHPKGEFLEIVFVGGYQCVVRKGQFKIGDLAIYVQPDSVVPEHPAFNFLWK